LNEIYSMPNMKKKYNFEVENTTEQKFINIRDFFVSFALLLYVCCLSSKHLPPRRRKLRVNARCYVDFHVDKLSDSHFFHVISLKGDLNLGFFLFFWSFLLFFK